MEHLVPVVAGVLQELVVLLVAELLVVAAQVAAGVLVAQVAVVVRAMGLCPAGRGTEERAPGPLQIQTLLQRAFAQWRFL